MILMISKFYKIKEGKQIQLSRVFFMNCRRTEEILFFQKILTEIFIEKNENGCESVKGG